MTKAGLARALGVTVYQVSLWHDGIDEWTADDIAVGLDRHPAELWADQWWSVQETRRDSNVQADGR